MVLERKTRIKHSGDEDTGLPWLREADSLGEKEERLMHCSRLLPPTLGPVPKGHQGRRGHTVASAEWDGRALAETARSSHFSLSLPG